MEEWAAVDIYDGKVVTLVRGKAGDGLTWATRPEEAAERWEEEGADGIHIVDLNGAFGSGSNGEEVRAILQRVTVPLQIGGGIRKKEDAERLLRLGASRVVIGTLAYREPSTLREIVKEVGAEQVVVAVDYDGDRVVSAGWTKKEELGVLDAVRHFEEVGVTTILATATSKDGTTSGPDLPTLSEIRATSGMEILGSGGIRTREDLTRLEKIGIDGAILGRALYEGTVKLKGRSE